MVPIRNECQLVPHGNYGSVWKFCFPLFQHVFFRGELFVPLILSKTIREKSNIIYTHIYVENIFPHVAVSFICYCAFVFNAQSSSSSKIIYTHSCTILFHLLVCSQFTFYSISHMISVICPIVAISPRHSTNEAKFICLIKDKELIRANKLNNSKVVHSL